MYTETVRVSAAIARCTVERSANLSEWRVRTPRDRRMQELARKLHAGRGYIIATEAEINERFGEGLAVSDNRLHMWTVDFLTGWRGYARYYMRRIR